MRRWCEYGNAFCACRFSQSMVKRGKRQLLQQREGEIGGVVGAQTIFSRQAHHLGVVARTDKLQRQSTKPRQCGMDKIVRNPAALFRAQQNAADLVGQQIGCDRVVASSASVFSSSGNSQAPAIEASTMNAISGGLPASSPEFLGW
jgi:hypothetical protein